MKIYDPQSGDKYLKNRYIKPNLLITFQTVQNNSDIYGCKFTGVIVLLDGFLQKSQTEIQELADLEEVTGGKSGEFPSVIERDDIRESIQCELPKKIYSQNPISTRW